MIKIKPSHKTCQNKKKPMLLFVLENSWRWTEKTTYVLGFLRRVIDQLRVWIDVEVSSPCHIDRTNRHDGNVSGGEDLHNDTTSDPCWEPHGQSECDLWPQEEVCDRGVFGLDRNAGGESRRSCGVTCRQWKFLTAKLHCRIIKGSHHKMVRGRHVMLTSLIVSLCSGKFRPV